MDKLWKGIKWLIVLAETVAVMSLIIYGIWVFNEYGFAYGDCDTMYDFSTGKVRTEYVNISNEYGREVGR